MKTTLQDLLHAINIFGEDYDVLVDGIDSIAVVPPVMLTEEGKKHFAKALNATVVVDYGTNHEHRYTCVSDADEKIDRKAWDLLSSLAGICSCEDFEIWFGGDNYTNAEMI